MRKCPLLLDVDTGIDDAVAIALASRLVEHELVALTTVAGNVPVELATENTLRVAAWLSLDVPVYRGMSAPLVRPLYTAREHHGHDGLGGWQVPTEPAPLQDVTAPEAIVQLARQHRDEITFVFAGPLTNLAVALSLEPRIAEWVPRLVVMGGAFVQRGNTTEQAEFNVFADPEAAAAVAAARMDATWVPLDATHQATLTREVWESLGTADSQAAILVREVYRRSFTELGKEESHLHDPLAVAVAESASLVETAAGTVVVGTDELDRGRTRIAEPAPRDAVHRVARGVDRAAFGAMLQRLLGD